MKHNFSFYKRISLVLGITTLLLGMIPMSVLGGVGLVSADDGGVIEPAPSEEPASLLVEEPAVPPVEEPAAPPADELVSDPPAPEAEPLIEEPLAEEVPTLEVSDESLSVMSSTIGDDPNVADELPDFGNNYNNGDCVTNDACEAAEPVTDPNEYTDQGTYGEKDYVLPDIGGNTANIVALKKGDTWYFFKKGSGETCVEDTFCVNFDDQGNVSVFSYQTQGDGYEGFEMIHFWFAEGTSDEGVSGCTDGSAINYDPLATVDDGSCQYEQKEILGCMDDTALNYDPEANVDDGSCKYGGGGGGGEGGGGGTPGPVSIPVAAGGPVAPLIVPVTGLDLNTPLAGLQKLLIFMGLMFFGVTMMLEGFERRFNK